MGMEISGVGGTQTEFHLPRTGSRKVKVSVEVPEVNLEEINRSVEALQRAYSSIVSKKLKFRVNREIDRVVVKVVDAETDSLIKEIPAAEIQRLVARIRETIGLLFDEKI